MSPVKCVLLSSGGTFAQKTKSAGGWIGFEQHPVSISVCQWGLTGIQRAMTSTLMKSSLSKSHRGSRESLNTGLRIRTQESGIRTQEMLSSRDLTASGAAA